MDFLIVILPVESLSLIKTREYISIAAGKRDWEMSSISSTPMVNLFVANAPFLYPFKASETRKVFWCFQGVEKGCIWSKWVKVLTF